MPILYDSILNDDREIRGISGTSIDEGDWEYLINCLGIEKIQVYAEYGQMAGVPWFAIWKNGEIRWRINAVFVECVNYKEA